MKKYLPYIAILFLASGCTNPLTQLQGRIDRLETNMTEMRNFQAEQTTKIAALETQIRGAEGKIEELQYSQGRRLGGDLSSLKKDFATLAKRVPPPAIVPASELEQDEQICQSGTGREVDLLAESLAKIRIGEFGAALSILQEGVDASLGQEFHPKMIFWQAISYEGMGETKKALEGYIDFIGRFPRNARTPLVLMRQASIFIRLGDKKAARITFNKVIADFPKSKEAAQARMRLKDVK